MAWQVASLLEAAAVTDDELVAAPGARKQIVVYGVHISADVKEVVSLESGGSTLVWRSYMGADNPEDHTSVEAPLFRCLANESLTLTTDGAGNTFVSVQYRIEPDYLRG